MNRRQTRTLVAGVLVLIGLGLFPPWDNVYVNEIGARHTQPAGFSWITQPPDVSGNPNWVGAEIYWPPLAIEWTVAVIVIAAFIYGQRDKNPDTQRLLHRYDAS